MKTLSEQAVDRAENYIASNARVLERHRFATLFRVGDPAMVVAALRPYRNADGGFGQALEPDGRMPGSQPAAIAAAFGFLDEVGRLGGELVRGACDHLSAICAEDGGLPFVHPNAEGYPRAPWWQIPQRYEGSLISTGSIARLLHKNEIDHPWLEPATDFCWRTIENLSAANTYETMGAIAFLDNVTDRDRARTAAERLGKIVRAQAMGADSDESYAPWDFVTNPDSLARGWFTDEELESSLDVLVDSQQQDGSWPVRWPAWTPVTAFEWGGWVTIDAMKILVNHGRRGSE
ncbi:hypothetical protein [Nocardia yunnanensis]|uniref:hypothetical protein n=1 Tax=Nocardia yunnanensis TaxID=2382165 RepID=UPI0013C40E28|nr:hypothetical protein [Nocardia yunnanensis]